MPTPRRRLNWMLLLCAGVALNLHPQAWAEAPDPATPRVLVEFNEAYKHVVQRVSPSVAHLLVFRRPDKKRTSAEEQMLRRLFPDRFPKDEDEAKDKPESDVPDVPQPDGNGSGWVFDAAGHLITNHHVVQGADRIVARFNDGTERVASVVGVDEKTDIAVLKVENLATTPAKLATKPAEQGEIVFAFGSPFRFAFSISQGIVSGKGRELGILRGRQGYEDFIQTDASVNPGNSGGPLVNIHGEVVGMNTAIATRTGGDQGLAFAIPIDMVQDVVESILAKGTVRRGYLGVYIDDLEPKMARTFGYTGSGALVMSPIPDSPGEKAGIAPGDIVTKIDGKAIDSAQTLRRQVARKSPGTKTVFEVYRKGKAIELTVQVGEQPAELASAPANPAAAPPAAAPVKLTREELLHKLGIEKLDAMSAELAETARLPFVPGVLVLSVRPNSAAAANLARGMVITQVMDQDVANADQLLDQLLKYDLSAGVRLSVRVGGLNRFMILELPLE